MLNQTLKSIMYIVISVFTLYFLGGIIPKLINLLDTGYPKTFCIAVYWIGILSILVVPQYFTWFTDEDVSLIAPIQSLAVFCISIMAVVVVTIVTESILSKIELSTTSGIIFTVCFWLFAILVMYVPQIFVYEPLREKFSEGINIGD